MLIEDMETWVKIVKEGKGYIYNDFGTQFPGNSVAWNTRDFNKLHKCYCSHVKRMSHETEGKLTKHFFDSKWQAIAWLDNYRKNDGYTFCQCMYEEV